MTKNTIYIVLTLIKAAIIIAGIPFVTLNFISWVKNKDGKKVKKGAIIFGGIILSILILTGIEFMIAFN